ncbi:MAG: FAD-dependent oxidoreductase [Coriobacteriia bacterium]
MREKKTGVVGNGVSRRDFVTGLTTSAVALSSIALLGGCSTKGSSGASPSTQNWDREADVVVVGFGGAGAAAAIEATKAGAKVLVLEKTKAGGGSTLINGGIMYLGGGTALQKKLGIEDTRDDMFKYMVAAAGPGANEELIGLYCDSSVEFYDWCVSVGMQFPEEFAPGKYVVTPEGTGLQYSGNERNAEYAAIAKPAARGHTPGISGAGIFSPLAKVVENSEAEIVYNAEGKSLITDDGGRVIGLQASIDGKTVSVKANRGVVLTTGGWALDKNMVAAYCPECLDAAVMIAVPTDLGTGIKMGQEVGADLRGMNKLSYSIPLYAYGDAITSGILVNRYGRRMLAEDCYASWTGLAVLRQGRKGWAIVDSKVAGSIRDPFGEKTKEPFATGNSIPELATAWGSIQMSCPARWTCTTQG